MTGGDDGRLARVLAVRRETPSAATVRLDLGTPLGHRAGQHVKVRIPGSGGPSRSYSVASPPDGRSAFELTVERLEGGAVSTVLHDQVRPGDEIEVRGPRGSFAWDGTTPALLVGGGSGLVPLMAMLRLARATGQSGLVRMVATARTPVDLFFREELVGPETTTAFSRVEGSLLRAPGHLRAADLRHALRPEATAYVCGPTGFVDHVRTLLVALGHDPDAIRTEAFGPTTDDPPPGQVSENPS